MGKIEESARIQRQTGRVQNAILTTLSVAGILSLMLVAPNAMKILQMTGVSGKRFNERSRSAVRRLLKNGYIEIVAERGHRSLRLTAKGKKALEKAENEAIIASGPIKPRKWDGRWRMIVFDIPERRKVTRNKLRETVRALGFLRLQDSVWIHPYDCEELIVLLKADLKVGKDILYAVIEKLENDRWIREHFGLRLD